MTTGTLLHPKCRRYLIYRVTTRRPMQYCLASIILFGFRSIVIAGVAVFDKAACLYRNLQFHLAHDSSSVLGQHGADYRSQRPAPKTVTRITYSSPSLFKAGSKLSTSRQVFRRARLQSRQKSVLLRVCVAQSPLSRRFPTHPGTLREIVSKSPCRPTTSR